MGSEWPLRTLEEVASRDPRPFAMGPFGSNIKAENYRDSGVPVIRGVNLAEVGGPPFISSDFVFLSSEKADELSSSNAFPGDLVFVAQGTVGKVGIVPRSLRYQRYVLSQNLMKASVDTSLVDPLFAFYFFRTREGQQEILSRVNPTGVPCISKPLSSLRSFRVSVPPLRDQQAIARILGTLDDKIELNRRMNETLEDMARALFKAWFVDFCPVYAKQAGGECGIPRDVADLFPPSLEKSDVGYIPKGWAISPLLSDCKLLSGGTPKTDREEYWNGDIPWASAKDVSQAKHTFLIASERSITRRGLEESATQLIPAMSTVIVARGATTGRMVVLGRDMAMNQTCYAVCSNSKTPFTLYCLLRHSIASLVHAAHGSVFDTITTSTFAQARVVEIPQALKARYEALVNPLFERILLNIKQSQTLASLRDTSVPKLISGELRVPNAERIVGRHL